MDTLIVLFARLIGNAADPFLIIPAVILGWRARNVVEIFLGAVAVAVAVTLLLMLIVQSQGRNLPWGELAALKLCAALLFSGAASFVGRRWRKPVDSPADGTPPAQ